MDTSLLIALLAALALGAGVLLGWFLGASRAKLAAEAIAPSDRSGARGAEPQVSD